MGFRDTMDHTLRQRLGVVHAALGLTAAFLSTIPLDGVIPITRLCGLGILCTWVFSLYKEDHRHKEVMHDPITVEDAALRIKHWMEKYGKDEDGIGEGESGVTGDSIEASSGSTGRPGYLADH